jgi:signal transduction histidine kinase
VDLGALIRETAASFQLQPDASGVTVAAEVDPDLPTAEIDPVRIRQVLTILLTNARQHTPDGGTIRVTSRREPAAVTSRREPTAPASSDAASISVIDTGPGIAADDLPHVFERFYKSPDSRGSGLGLAIARNLVALHGGTIAVDSPPGQGATLRFTLPLR